MPSTTSRSSMPHRGDVAEWLDHAVERIVKTLDPESVMLFGSFARGTESRTSDIDLFVVWETELAPLDRIGRVLDLLRDAPRPIEPIVYTPDELERNRAIPFVRRLLSEAWVLYERNWSEA